ncbi:MAG: hypothetical protein KJ550_12515 [Proteobacteria bacterium]|nr:hypothetical protein [Desulfobacteraceae bacterium]MBU4014267.1 hypothetical protein [Pseudomonadota bacterium]
MEKEIDPDKKTIEIDPDYKKIIDRCAESGENFVINNGNAMHAAYLLTKFFAKAEDQVRIFTGVLFAEVFDGQPLIDAAVEFLSRSANNKIVVAFQEKEGEEEKRGRVLKRNFVKKLTTTLPKNSGKLEIYSIPLDLDGQVNHFAVMDSKAFRYELDHDKKSAVANFGDQKNSGKLKEFFDKLIAGHSTKVTIHV